MPKDNPIIIKPISESLHGRWKPHEGEEGHSLLHSKIPDSSRELVRDAAISILSKCVPPSEQCGHETGLVVGYIQSGKTLSFEMVIALAHDNDFRIVIVVTGIAKNLFNQSVDRLCNDLQIDELHRVRRWQLFKNPKADNTLVTTIRNTIESWGEEYGAKRTVLITVLKNHQHLKNLVQLVKKIQKPGTQNPPTLIIDDEADQASLNTKPHQTTKSTTYKLLTDLRKEFSNHTYLQYTATPQAPLLVNIIDSLSPNFVQVLDPGDAYIGGREFFTDPSLHVHIIPSEDIFSNENPLMSPPESLLRALRTFLVGVAIGIQQDSGKGCRSMLVHPSYKIDLHQEYTNWIRRVFKQWKQILDLSDKNNPERENLIEQFRIAYNDLYNTTEGTLQPFNTLIDPLKEAFRQTRIEPVNSRNTNSIEWSSSYGWILVGGKSMDRGFTVEGLTVTYMPRGIGVGHADAIQQRARFLGYKRPYFGFCRVYLGEETLNAFRVYVEHEDYIRSQLKKWQDCGKPLNHWKRVFILDEALRPCRGNVLEFDYIRGNFSNKWFYPRFVLNSKDITFSNRKVINEFIKKHRFSDCDSYETSWQRHKICQNVPLKSVIEDLLIKMRVTDVIDSHKNIGLLLQLKKALDINPSEICTVYLMSAESEKRRTREINPKGGIKQLFQGPSSSGSTHNSYPGDQAIREEKNITVQIHRLDLKQEQSIVAEDVPVLGIWVPKRLAKSWISQP